MALTKTQTIIGGVTIAVVLAAIIATVVVVEQKKNKKKPAPPATSNLSELSGDAIENVIVRSCATCNTRTTSVSAQGSQTFMIIMWILVFFFLVLFFIAVAKPDSF